MSANETQLAASELPPAAPAHDEAAPLAHHFRDLGQQHEAATLGMWVFLATELLFFGGMFMAYTLFRTRYPSAWELGSSHLVLWIGTLNTLILLTSSLTMVLAVHGARTGHRRQLILCLSLTIALGCTFLAFKALEYYIDYREALIPVLNFDIDQELKEYNEKQLKMYKEEQGEKPRLANRREVELFMWLYFCMTGVHALHMIVGVGVLSVILALARRGRFTPSYYFPVDVAGLYWHFVDIIWIFLLPLLYLVAEHGS